DQKETIVALKHLFTHEGVPVCFYVDTGPHFGTATKEFAEKHGALWINAPVAAKKTVGMVEKGNELIQRILKKSGPAHLFHERIHSSAFEMNRREIVHLGYSPFEIHR